MMYPIFDYNPQINKSKAEYFYNISGWSEEAPHANLYFNYDVPYKLLE